MRYVRSAGNNVTREYVSNLSSCPDLRADRTLPKATGHANRLRGPGGNGYALTAKRLVSPAAIMSAGTTPATQTPSGHVERHAQRGAADEATGKHELS